MTHTQCDIERTKTRQARVRDLMTPAPLTISPATSVHEAYRLMQDQCIGISRSVRTDAWSASSASATCGWCYPRQPPASPLTNCTTC